MDYEFQHEGVVHRIQLDAEGDSYRADLGNGPVSIDARAISSNCLSLILEGRSYEVYIASSEGKTYVYFEGKQICLEEPAAGTGIGSTADGAHGEAEGFVSAPMPGTIVAVQVQAGDRVAKGQSLVIVESMKMENALRSPADGLVSKVHYQDGDLVDAGVPLVEPEHDEKND